MDIYLKIAITLTVFSFIPLVFNMFDNKFRRWGIKKFGGDDNFTGAAAMCAISPMIIWILVKVWMY